MIFKKIRKGHADWRNFLCSTPARDYVFQKDAYEDQIDRAAKNIRNTDCIIIGAGAGASTAAGIQYGGKRFTDNFAEFIKKLGWEYQIDFGEGKNWIDADLNPQELFEKTIEILNNRIHLAEKLDKLKNDYCKFNDINLKEFEKLINS